MKTITFLILVTAMVPLYASSANVTVTIDNIKKDSGQIGCALFNLGDGFPMGAEPLKQYWVPANKKGVTCWFGGLEYGEYAVSIVHDLNGNKITDTNFLGIPKEAWGVSNNVRPALRAPTFEEAKILIEGDANIVINIE